MDTVPLQGITARAAPRGVSVNYNAGTSDSSAASTAAAASVAVVFASLDESEGSDLSSIDLGSTQDALISAVAAANPNTIVVLNTGSAVTMPWLSSVKGVLEAWYPGQEDGTAIASLLFGSTDPSGHLTVTFPTSLSQVPASTTAQFPGQNGTVQYSEGVDVGYRWYDAKSLTPQFPFGFGLSYTSFGFSNLHVGSLTAGGQATVTATVTNTGSRAGAEVAQLYVDEPAASGQPPLQLEGFQRVNLQPGASQTVTFELTQQNLQYWNSSSNAWATSTGNYGIEVGDSNASLPLSGTLAVSAAQLGQPVTLTNPGPQEGLAGQSTSVAVSAADSTSGQTLSYSATGLPAGVSISPTSGALSGTPTTAGSSTVTVTAKDGNGAQASTSFVWTVVPAAALPATPLVGYNGLCLDLSGDSNANGSAVDVYTCNGTNGQEWTEEANGSVQANGYCLDVTSGGTASGTLVELYTCNGSGAQVWQPQSDGALLNPQSGLCLTDPKAPPPRRRHADPDPWPATAARGPVLEVSPAGTASGGSATPHGTDRAGHRPISGLCMDAFAAANTANGHQGRHLHVQRHERPAVDGRARTRRSRPWAIAWTRPAAGPPTARWSTCTRATAPGRRSGRPGPTARWSTRSPAPASTTPACPPHPAPRSRSGPAPAPPTSPGPCPDGSAFPRPSHGPPKAPISRRRIEEIAWGRTAR